MTQPHEGQGIGSPGRSGPTTAAYPWITPAFSSRRTRSVGALADIDTARADSAKPARPVPLEDVEDVRSVASRENVVIRDGWQGPADSSTRPCRW